MFVPHEPDSRVNIFVNSRNMFYKSLYEQRNLPIVRFFPKFGPHSKLQFENNTWLRHVFLETFAHFEKVHFCVKVSKNRLKLRKFNSVVTVRDVISIFRTTPKIPVEYGVLSKIKIFSYHSFSKKSIHLCRTLFGLLTGFMGPVMLLLKWMFDI